MSSTIPYKMKNAKNAGEALAAKFEGPALSLIDFKRLVIKQSFSSANDMDLQVINEQTSEGLLSSNNSPLPTQRVEFEGDQTPVPRNTTVIVKRMPLASGKEIMSVAQLCASIADECAGPGLPFPRPHRCRSARTRPTSSGSAKPRSKRSRTARRPGAVLVWPSV